MVSPVLNFFQAFFFYILDSKHYNSITTIHVNERTQFLLKPQYYNTPAAPITVFSASLDLLHKHYIVTRFWQINAENVKQLFCTIVCSLMMGQ